MSSYVSTVGSNINKQQAQQAASTVLSYAGTFLSNVATRSSQYVQQSNLSASTFLNPLTSTSASLSLYANNDDIERDLDRLYHSRVRPLLDAVDKLRNILHTTDIKLPTIVVVG